MIFQVILFYVFAITILAAAIKVVTAKNPVHAALWLVLTFWSSACCWVLLQAEFLGIVLVLVYVGAVMVLFLFVVMMLNIDVEKMREGFWHHFPVSLTVGVLMALVLILVLVSPKADLGQFGVLKDIPAEYNTVQALGTQIYTTYLLPFELAAVLLVLGMVSAIALVHRKNTNPRYIQPSEQVSVKAEDCFRMVKVDPVRVPDESSQDDEISEEKEKES